MVVHVVTANAGQFSNDLYTSLFEDRRVAEARSLQDKGCSKSSGGDDNHLAGLDLLDGGDIGVESRVGAELDADSLLAIKQNPQDLVLDKHAQLGVVAILESGVEIGVGRILSLAIGADVLQVALG